MKLVHPFNLFQRTFPIDLGTTLFRTMVMDGVIVDARAGGIIYGKGLAGETGGVPLIRQSGTRLEFSGYAEPNGFILNPDASTRNHNRVKLISGALTKPTMGEDETPDITRVICAMAQPYNRFVWIHHTQAVFTSKQTELHFNELNALNDEPSRFNFCDLEMYFPRLEQGTEDGII